MTRFELGPQNTTVFFMHSHQQYIPDAYPTLPVRVAENEVVDLPRRIAALKQSDADPTVIGALYDRLDAAYEVLNSY